MRAGARTAEAPRNCATHWQYLLSNKGTVSTCSAPGCGHLWSTDTREAEAGSTDAA